jgi:membrane-associated phospholipid phosphatase
MQDAQDAPSTMKLSDLGGLLPVDRLLLMALAILAAIAAAFHPRPTPFLLLFGALAAFIYTSAKFAPVSRATDAVHAFAPALVISGIFESVGYLVGAANPMRWDATFAALDTRLFGSLVPAWHDAFGRPWWVTDLFSLFYMSYYVAPVAVGAALYANRRREEFDRYAFGLLFILVVCYLGYFACPTSGPRVPIEDGPAVLGGSVVSDVIRRLLRAGELNTWDAFPSGHTAVAVTVLIYGWRLLPSWRVSLSVIAAGIIFSTVYLSHHYIIDLFAGAGLALAAIMLMPYLERAFGFPAAPAISERELHAERR